MIRLEEGTYFGHIVEHVALELTELTGIGKSHGKTRHDTGSIYNVAIEFRSEKASTYLLQQAVKLVDALVRKRSFQLQPVLDEAKRLVLDALRRRKPEGSDGLVPRHGIPDRAYGLRRGPGARGHLR